MRQHIGESKVFYTASVIPNSTTLQWIVRSLIKEEDDLVKSLHDKFITLIVMSSHGAAHEDHGLECGKMTNLAHSTPREVSW